MSAGPTYLRYTLTLNAPAIVTTLSGDPNSVETLPFIPGNTIRGALASRLKDTNPSFAEIILSGRVRFLHAYPLDGESRALPMPISWQREKGAAEDELIDLAGYTGIWPTKPLCRAATPFIAFNGSFKNRLQPFTDARMHQQRDRVKGRSWTESNTDNSEIPHGAIFSYQYLQAAQKFQGLICIDNQITNANKISCTIREHLDRQTLLVGRSRRAGYGGAATISFLPDSESREANWGDIQNDVAPNSLFQAYLVSPCIIRNQETGQIDPCALPNELIQTLGQDTVSLARTFWNFEIAGGFNRQWKIEVPQVYAVKSGSILVLQAKQPIPANKLREIEHHGLGERRVEGFGRLLFIRHCQQPEVCTSQAKTASPETSQLHPNELATFLQKRIIDAAIAQEIERQVANLAMRAEKIPPNSLLGRLRTVLRAAPLDVTSAIETLKKWLRDPDSQDKEEVLKKEARDKLRHCMLNIKGESKPLIVWIKERIDDPLQDFPIAHLLKKHRLLNQHTMEEILLSSKQAYAVRLVDSLLNALSVKSRGDQTGDRLEGGHHEQ